MIPKVRCSIIEEPYFLKAIPIDFDWYEGVSPDYDNVVLATGDFNSCPKCQKFSKKKTCCEITPILSPIYKRVINSKGDVMDMVDVDLYTLYAAYKHRLFYFSWAEETGLSITLSYDDLVVQYSLKPF